MRKRGESGQTTPSISCRPASVVRERRAKIVDQAASTCFHGGRGQGSRYKNEPGGAGMCTCGCDVCLHRRGLGVRCHPRSGTPITTESAVAQGHRVWTSCVGPRSRVGGGSSGTAPRAVATLWPFEPAAQPLARGAARSRSSHRGEHERYQDGRACAGRVSHEENRHHRRTADATGVHQRLHHSAYGRGRYSIPGKGDRPCGALDAGPHSHGRVRCVPFRNCARDLEGTRSTEGV